MEEKKEVAGAQTIIKIHSKDVILTKLAELETHIIAYEKLYKFYLILSCTIFYIGHVVNCSLLCTLIGQANIGSLLFAITTAILNLFTQTFKVHEKKNEYKRKLERLKNSKKEVEKKLMIGIKTEEEKLYVYEYIFNEIK